MRKRNWRLVILGGFLIIVAVVVFLFVTSLGAYSTDPVEFTRLIGQFSGTMIGVSVALIIIGLIGKKA